ncbi:unnamed protein product [Phytophthora lilii]|uniref:Unnamed protein product n=1 Tax=Phytophthora lilii TaxID=2077276 RepID=A0A9W6WX99_9STRA|nr:unnamed protein product [Phytophthora lilii]
MGCCRLAMFSLVVTVLAAVTTADLTPDQVQTWMLSNQDFDWQQVEANAVVRIAGKGVQDADGNLYFAGSKTTDNSNVDQLDIFAAKLNADGILNWTKLVR